MTPQHIAEAAERRRFYNSSEIRHSPILVFADAEILADAYIAEQKERELTFRINEMDAIKRAIMDPPDNPEAWPDWVYEARRAVKMARSANPNWLTELLAILGWQFGTVHQALNAVRRLVEAERDQEAKQAKKPKIFDFPTAWAIQNEVGPSLDHHPRCSSVPGWDKLSGPGLLCDCGAVQKEWMRRNKEDIRNEQNTPKVDHN